MRRTRGQFNDVLIVGEHLVVRCPRSNDGAASLEREVALLQSLHGRLPLAVPDPVLIDLDAHGLGRHVGVYAMIPGQALTPEALVACSDTDRCAIATQLGEFLAALHATPTSLLPSSTPIADRPADWIALFDAFAAELFPVMRPDARSTVAAALEAFRADAPTMDWTPVLRHGDFGGENIRFDAATRRVTGVIDFESAALGDPAVDLAALSGLGDAFVNGVIAAYPALGHPAVRRRADFARSTFALQQALWAKRAGDAEDYADGMRAYL